MTNLTNIKGQLRYNLTHSCGDVEFHTFPKVITPEINVIEYLEFEHALYDAEIQDLCRKDSHLTLSLGVPNNPHTHSHLFVIWVYLSWCNGEKDKLVDYN